MARTPAAQKRFDAIGRTVDYLMDDWTTLKPGMSQHEAAAKIRELKKLGRTERWRCAVTRWENMVLAKEPWENTKLDWAITQGAIFANHAVQ